MSGKWVIALLVVLLAVSAQGATSGTVVRLGGIGVPSHDTACGTFDAPLENGVFTIGEHRMCYGTLYNSQDDQGVFGVMQYPVGNVQHNVRLNIDHVAAWTMNWKAQRCGEVYLVDGIHESTLAPLLVPNTIWIAARDPSSCRTEPPYGSAPLIETDLLASIQQNLRPVTLVQSFSKIVDFRNKAPFPNVHDNKWSAVYTGTIYADADQQYQFRLCADNAATLFIDDREVIKNAGWGNALENCKTFTTGSWVKNQPHKIRIRFQELDGNAKLQLQWRKAKTQNRYQFIPNAQLNPSNDPDSTQRGGLSVQYYDGYFVNPVDPSDVALVDGEIDGRSRMVSVVTALSYAGDADPKFALQRMCVYHCCDWDGDSLPTQACAIGGQTVDVDDYNICEGIDADLNERVCTYYDAASQDTCHDGHIAAWLPGSSGNSCCGDDLDDTGRTLQSNGITYTCGIVRTIDGVDRYAWVNAKEQTPQDVRGDMLRGVTPAGESYDMFSVGNNFVACYAKPDNVADRISAISLNSVRAISPIGNPFVVHSYLCYKQGENAAYELAECVLPSQQVPFSRNTLWDTERAVRASQPVPILRLFDTLNLPDVEHSLDANNQVTITALANHITSNSITLDPQRGGPWSSLVIQPSVQPQTSNTGAARIVVPVRPTNISPSYYVLIPFRFDHYYPVDIYLDGTTSHHAGFLTDHALSTPVPGKWQLAKIPLTSMAAGETLDSISFVMNKGHPQYVDTQAGFYYIGAISLDTGAIRYCSNRDQVATGSTQSLSEWVTDLDLAAGMSACSNALYTQWTGNRCCGDDMVSSVFGRGEMYADSLGTCFAGRMITTGGLVQTYQLLINGQQFTFYCDQASCTYPIPYPVPDVPGGLFITGPDARYAKFTVANANTTNDYTDTITLSRSSPTIIISNNVAQGCQAPNYVTSLRQSTNNALLINRSSFTSSVGATCVVQGNYFCNGSGWVNQDVGAGEYTDPIASRNRNVTSRAFNTSVAVPYSCCGPGSCWDGNTCIKDMSATNLPPLDADSNGNGNRCIAGTWTFSTRKFDWYNDKSGYCAKASQCYVAGSTCADDKTYVGDFYCDNGNWTTRTKLLAGHMLKLAEGEQSYTLFCDQYDRALNYYGAVVRDGEDVATVLSNLIISPADNSGFYTDSKCDVAATNEEELCANNFCVLSYGDKVVIGTSLNEDLNAQSLLGSYFSLQTCSAQSASFVNCGNGWQYHGDLKLLLYDKQQRSSGLFAFISSIFQGITDIFRYLFSWNAKGKVAPTPIDVSSVSFQPMSNRLYVAKDGSLDVMGVYEYRGTLTGMTAYMGVKYTGFSNNICTAVDRYNSPLYNCTRIGNTYFVRAADSINNQVVPFKNEWPAFTSSLRLEQS